MLKSISPISLFLKYFWVNIFYILPATFVFCIPNFFTSIHRFVIDCILPFCLGNLLSFLWEIGRYIRQEKQIGGGTPQPVSSAFWNNIYYIFPVCLMNASIAVFEICLLSSEEWHRGHIRENILYLSLLFLLFLAVNWILASFFSWLVQAFASEIFGLFHQKKKQDFAFENFQSENVIFGGFPAVSATKTLYEISHPTGLAGKFFWRWLQINLIFFVPAAVGIGLGWLPLDPDLVKSRYFLPIELILWAYINLLAVFGSVIWFIVHALLEENAGRALENFRKKPSGALLYWFLKANFIAVLPILFLEILGKHLPENLAFFDPARQSIRTIPPNLFWDFLFGNLALLPMAVFQAYQTKKSGEKRAASLQKKGGREATD